MTIAFDPFPSPTWCQDRAIKSAALFFTSGGLVFISIAEAPSRKSSIFIPMRAIGNKPTTLVIDVLPPTQSSIGKIPIQSC